MKKTISFILAVLMLFSGLCVFSAEENAVTVYVDGLKINFDVDPIIESGRTLVPLRYIFESLGATVEWRGETLTAVAKKGEDTIEISVGSNILYKNGNPTELDVGAKLIDGRTLVPARAVSEGMGCDVKWDADERRVIIRSKGSLMFSELSPADEAIVKANYPKTYEKLIFESLYGNFQKSGKEYFKGISQNADETRIFVNYVWDMGIMSSILSVQEKSETVYVLNTYDKFTDDMIKEAYIILASKIGIGSKNAFTSSYEKTTGGKDVLLLTMNDATLGCTYIGVVATDDDVRYFLLVEIDGKNELCEMKPTGMTTYSRSAKDKSGFLKAVENVL